MQSFDNHHGCRIHGDLADPECFGCLIGSVVDRAWLESIDRLVAERFPDRDLHPSF